MSDPSGVDDRDDLEQRIDCPKCGAAMARVQVGTVSADRCETCGGVWLDALEKERLLAVKGGARSLDIHTPGHAKPADAKHPIKCPRDHSQLIRMIDLHQRHIQYESCKLCGGVFFDAGELRDLSEYTLRERLGL